MVRYIDFEQGRQSELQSQDSSGEYRLFSLLNPPRLGNKTHHSNLNLCFSYTDHDSKQD